MREVFHRIGVEMPEQVFQEVWQEAERRDPHREVSTRVYTCLHEHAYMNVCNAVGLELQQNSHTAF